MKFSNAVKTVTTAMLCFITLLSTTVHAQTYKTAADTVKLNQEYAVLKKDTAELNAKLFKARSKSDGYQAKVASTTDQADKAAQASKDQAATAANGNNIKAISKEEKKAKKANSDANAAADAKDDQKDNEKDIKKFSAQLAKKQKRLSELDRQRTAIMSGAASSRQ
jgi:hypothetical protein